MRLENLKIGTRLNLAFGLLVVLIVALLALAFFSLTSMNSSVDGITRSSESIRWANNVRSNVQKANGSIMAMVIVNSEKTRVEQKKIIETAQKLYQQELGKLEKASQSGSAKELLAKLKEAIAAGAKDNAKVVELVESDLPDLAMGTFVGNMPMLNKITELCDAIVNNQEQQNEAYEKAARGSYGTARNFLFAMGAIILGMAVMVALLLTRSIVKPLQRGVDAANRLASGDLTATIEATGKDELNSLLGAIGNTTLSLRAIMAEIKSTADGLTSTSVQLSTNSTEMSENAKGQANRATQVATASEEMTQTVMDVARNTSTIASSAAGTAATAEKGEESVGRTVTEISAIAETAKESTRIVEALGNQSQQICNIIGVISDIADQTNLLALNAAIEAARAGEHGRGFAVVADEVRKLAEKTAGATHEIEQTIGSITSNVEKAVSAMKQTLTKVDSGVRLSQESGTALRNIVTAVGELQGMIDQIASAAEEMSATSDEIARDIEGIAHAASDNSSNAEQTAESSVVMSQLALNLQSILGKFTL